MCVCLICGFWLLWILADVTISRDLFIQSFGFRELDVAGGWWMLVVMQIPLPSSNEKKAAAAFSELVFSLQRGDERKSTPTVKNLNFEESCFVPNAFLF